MTDALLELVRAADPLDPAELASWSASDRLLARAFASPAEELPRHRRLLPIAVGVLAASAGTVAVAVATGVLGGPAPDPVKAHLAELDRGIPADLRYDADVEHARTVAATGSGALYLADLADGGYCIEVASTGGSPRGASCVPRARLEGLKLDVTAPIAVDAQAPLLVGGRANDPRIARVFARYTDGTVADIPFGLDRAWLLEVPDAQRATALAKGVTVVGVDSTGTAVSTVHVPALRDDDPRGTAHDGKDPLVLTTTSDGEDLTRVLGIQGRVNLSGVITLQLSFPDGTMLAVPVAADGTYRVALPADRQDDFASAPGTLVALREGEVVASRPVLSVAGWRARNG